MLDMIPIRDDFPILTQRIHGQPLVYLDNAATTHKPLGVVNSMVRFYSTSNSNIHRGVHSLSEQASGAYEGARVKVQQFIHAADPAEIVFTRGATESINLVAASFGEAFVDEGDEIVITEMEHHSNIVPWQTLCRRKGSVLKVVPMRADGTLAVDRLELFFSVKTRLLALTYVSNVLGAINPVRQIIDLAHAHDVPVLIDGAQAIQHMMIDVQDLDCDFFAFSGHKIYAATGIGVLFGKEKWLEAMPPYQSGGGMIKSVDFVETTYGELPIKFEAGTPNIAGAVSLAAAIDYVQRIGLDRIAIYEEDVLQYAIQQLQALDGIALYGPTRQRCGSVSFNLDGMHPYDVGMLLDKMGIAVRTGTLCAAPVMRHFGISGALRASFALYNTRAEVDRLMIGLKKARQLLGK
ncbi:MAG: cysteine desulfurase [Thermodesulfobacteriota bacterium]|nr:cysteine desulfurase [Thermodesulfobacteriota bacterium]